LERKRERKKSELFNETTNIPKKGTSNKASGVSTLRRGHITRRGDGVMKGKWKGVS